MERAIDAGNAIWIKAWAKGDTAMILDKFRRRKNSSRAAKFIGRKEIYSLMRCKKKKTRRAGGCL